MTDLPDAVDIAFDSDESLTLEQIYESVRTQISGKLTESDRRQIERILHSHRQRGLVRKNRQGRYETGPGVIKERRLPICGTPEMMKYNSLKGLVRSFISYRKGEAFTLLDVSDFRQFYDDAVRNRYMIKKFIDELCGDGQLEPVRPETYRATASFKKVPETDAYFTMTKHILESRRKPGTVPP